MPTYQYACTECDEQLEVVQSFSDASLTECPACSGRLRKKYGAVGVVFKGSGFYKTDSRGEGKKDAAPSGSGTGEAKKDSAPAASSSSTSTSTPGSSSGSTSSSSSSTSAA